MYLWYMVIVLRVYVLLYYVIDIIETKFGRVSSYTGST